MPPTLYKNLGISSPQEAAELEQDLGIRFNDFTPRQCETWQQQTVYLGLYAQTQTYTHAARGAGVTVRKVRTWQTENTLGFNQRLKLAVLEYTEDIDLMLLEHARKPDCSPALLMMFVRAQMPEKYGPARSSAPSRSNHCNHHDGPKSASSDSDHDSLDDLKQFAGLTEPDSVPQSNASNSPDDETPNAQDPAPYDELTIPHDDNPTDDNHQIMTARDTQPNHVPAPNTQNPAPSLNRRQRRQLQRNSKRKHQNSHRPRAPN